MSGALACYAISLLVYGLGIFDAFFTARRTRADYELKDYNRWQAYVPGDNRDESLDSRSYGAIPITSIIGRAGFIYAPSENWTRFGTLR
jgi:hypothetical protein